MSILKILTGFTQVLSSMITSFNVPAVAVPINFQKIVDIAAKV